MKRINSLARRFALVAGFALVAAGLGSCSGGNVGLPPLRVVAFNFDPIHRLMSRSDFRFVWNIVLNWNDLPATPNRN